MEISILLRNWALSFPATKGLERFLSTQLAWKDALLMLERVQQGAARWRCC